MHLSVFGLSCFKEFFKDLFLVSNCLKFVLEMYFLSYKEMIYSFPDDTNPYIWDSTLKSVQESYNTILSKLLVGLK